MSAPTSSGSPVSGGTVAAPDSGPSHGFDGSEPERYEPGGLLGKGGMGEVRVMYDRRLDRLVASKVPRLDDIQAQQRLEREARLTARLSHPGIVPVYGAGRDDRGRVHYTMPVITGRTLAEAIHESPNLEARLRLVRALLDASEAIAYAHSRGIIHRDLKPANILLGEFGDTMLVDWGLALQSPYRAHGAAGTRGYTSPEQQRGEQLDGRTDVYSLGACLLEVLSGEAPQGSGALESLHQRCPGAPVELIAIARRALATGPEDRYPDAKTLAAELESWFAGRRVAAYDYNPAELLRLAARTWKVPLAVLALALVVIAGTLVAGWITTSRQRDRAEQAEAHAIAEQRSSETQLGRTLVAQALVASEEGRRAQAETLAAEALVRVASPEARGLLAGVAGLPRAERIRQLPLPTCGNFGVDREGARLVCISPGSLDLYDAEDLRRKARLEASLASLSFNATPWLVLRPAAEDLKLWDGNEVVDLGPAKRAEAPLPGGPDSTVTVLRTARAVLVVVPETRELLELPACLNSDVIESVWASEREIATVCMDGSVWLHDGSRAEKLLQIDPKDGVPMALRGDPDHPNRGVVTTSAGLLLTVDFARASIDQQFVIGPRVVVDLAVHGHLLAASTDRGTVIVWDLDTGRTLAQLPATGRLRVRWRESGRVLRIVGDELTDWRIPTAPSTGIYSSESGIASITISPGDGEVAASHGDGTLRVWNLRDETVITEHRWHDGVLKDVSFSPDGRLLAAAATSERGVQVFLRADWSRRLARGRAGYRRIAWLDAHTLVGASYKRNLSTWHVGTSGEVITTEPDVPTEFMVADMGTHPGLGSLAILLSNGDVRDFGANEAGTALLRSDTGGQAITRTGGWTVIATAQQLRVFGPEGEVRDAPIARFRPIEVAVDLQRRWIAIGTLEGAALLYDWETLELRAILRGHEGRVSATRFTHDGRFLLTGSWDGDIRRWDLSLIRQDPERLRATLRDAWGMDLEAALKR